MSFKKILAAIVTIVVSANVSAGPDQVAVHVTPELLATQAGIPSNWRVNYKGYAFDIENETNSIIDIAIKVNTWSYPKNANLLLSSTWVESGGCGVQSLGPQQFIICKIGPKGHLELGYNSPKPESEATDFIEGTFTLAKIGF